MTSPVRDRGRPATPRTRVRAPELVGRRWVGTGGADLSLAELRGRIVLLDFWTSCCVNCQHVLDELRELGPCTIVPRLDALPDLEALDPEALSIGWEVTLRAAVTREAIEDVFLFAQDEVRLTLTPLDGQAEGAGGESRQVSRAARRSARAGSTHRSMTSWGRAPMAREMPKMTV